ncbi:MazG-like family protein [Streptomyces sp. Ju416(a)]|uniref:MazG-like family protein n=1 Tax=Streptomyces sp. Ju416(a) TaxID=3446591 RepID=UPI00403DD828
MDTLWDNIEKLSAVCRAAGAHLPDEELKALQVGKVAEEAGEAMHALHDLKGLTTCGDDHTWSEVQNDLAGSVIAALLAMHYIDPTCARATFDEILRRRTQRGRRRGLTTAARTVGRADEAQPAIMLEGLRRGDKRVSTSHPTLTLHEVPAIAVVILRPIDFPGKHLVPLLSRFRQPASRPVASPTKTGNSRRPNLRTMRHSKSVDAY